jgi:membrane protein YqaA with SNARE-associated domain
MRSVFSSFLGYFLTPVGLVVMGALDASLVFFLPLGIDFVVIILSARKPELFWLYALLATAGSLAGAALTYWIGRLVGKHGLTRFVKRSKLERIERRVSHGAAVSVAALAIIPPPFPFTPLVLTSGALRANPWTFFVTLSGVRLLRFGVESGLAAYYGRGILAWMNSPTFTAVVTGMIAIAVIGTAISLVAVIRSSREHGGQRLDSKSQ